MEDEEWKERRREVGGRGGVARGGRQASEGERERLCLLLSQINHLLLPLRTLGRKEGERDGGAEGRKGGEWPLSLSEKGNQQCPRRLHFSGSLGRPKGEKHFWRIGAST